MDDLVSAAEIADRLGMNKSTVVHDWRYERYRLSGSREDDRTRRHLGLA